MTAPRYRVGRRPLRQGDRVLLPGDPVDVTGWSRVEAWERAGSIVRVN